MNKTRVASKLIRIAEGMIKEGDVLYDSMMEFADALVEARINADDFVRAIEENEFPTKERVLRKMKEIREELENILGRVNDLVREV